MSKRNTALTGATTGASIGTQMAPGWGTLAGAAIGGLAGGLLGEDDNSQDYYEKIMREAQNIPLPELKQMRPELYAEVMRLNPELESAITLGPSAMEGISTDPALRQAQMSALQKLQGISDAGGRDAQFMSENARLQNDINANLAGNQGAIQQNLAARGLSGGMTEMVQRQMSAQQAANRQAQAGLDINAQAQQRALAALTQGANLGGAMEAQQFGQQSAIAQAKDLVNKFNTGNMQDVNSRNVGARNVAQASNVQNAQNVANLNTGARQQANEYNLNIPQQQYSNQLAKYGLTSNAAQGAAQNQARQTQQNNKFLGGAFQSAAQAYGNMKQLTEDDLARKRGF